MPARHVRPSHVNDYFREKAIPFEDTPEFWEGAMKPAKDMGFTIDVTDVNRWKVTSPIGKVVTYTGFPLNKNYIGVVLYHALMSQKLH